MFGDELYSDQGESGPLAQQNGEADCRKG
jgi:hypothetical protein